ncbi:hypothetical protein MRX96_050047 [Rhipicephalus microplus]
MTSWDLTMRRPSNYRCALSAAVVVALFTTIAYSYSLDDTTTRAREDKEPLRALPRARRDKGKRQRLCLKERDYMRGDGEETSSVHVWWRQQPMLLIEQMQASVRTPKERTSQLSMPAKEGARMNEGYAPRQT